MTETKRVEPVLTIADLVETLMQSGKFKPKEIAIAKTNGDFFVPNYTAFCYLVRALNEHVATETLPGGGIPVVRVSFYRKDMSVYSFQSHNEGIPNL